MRHIDRIPLSRSAHLALGKLQATVDRSNDPPKTATRLWKTARASSKDRGAFQDVGEKLRRMSRGRHRCMYCEDNEGTDIEHHRPKSAYPHHCFAWPNLLLACSHCNSNAKRDLFPLDAQGNPLLLDPTVDDPYEHIAFVPETGQFQGLTPRGERTVRQALEDLPFQAVVHHFFRDALEGRASVPVGLRAIVCANRSEWEWAR
ncbi:MAG TPA: hypothetical protein PLI95_22990 [Polyangiaceae bacterium]|nr:hypothetical protein [Polyangiaceae bacterium]